MEALSVAAQKRPKRATLEGITVPKELQDRGASSPGVPDAAEDAGLMQITSENFLGNIHLKFLALNL